MKTFMRVLVICAAIGMGVPAAEAQTPTPTAPKLTMQWLATLSFSPSTVFAGSNVTGTVTLLRPATKDLSVKLFLAEAGLVENGFQANDGASMPSTVTVPAGSSQVTFQVTTNQPTSTSGSKTHSVIATYGSERKSASFTTQPIKPKQP